jgi:hypothetical protein
MHDPGVWVIVLGAIILLAGIAVAIIVPREGAKIKALLAPLLGSPLPPEWGQLAQMAGALANLLLQRVFNYIRLIGLLGGIGASIIGVILILLGVAI